MPFNVWLSFVSFSASLRPHFVPLEDIGPKWNEVGRALKPGPAASTFNACASVGSRLEISSDFVPLGTLVLKWNEMVWGKNKKADKSILKINVHKNTR